MKNTNELGQGVGNSNITSSVPKEYTNLVWSEEFDGDSLDTGMWQCRGSYYSKQLDCHCGEEPELIKVENSCLTMACQIWKDENDPNVTHACPPTVVTANSMNYRYGYLEMRAKVPFKHSVWPALWLCQLEKYYAAPDRCGYGVEVDVFEIFGSTEGKVIPNLHKWFNAEWAKNNALPKTHSMTGAKSIYQFKDTTDLSNEWHVYGFEWTDEYMSMYVDGEEYIRYDLSDNYDGLSDMSGFQNPAYILLSLAVYTKGKHDGGGREPIDSDFPCEFVIDYLRLYQNPNQENNLCEITP